MYNFQFINSKKKWMKVEQYKQKWKKINMLKKARKNLMNLKFLIESTNKKKGV